MKNLIQYNYSISQHFFTYLKGDMTKDQLIATLKRFETRYREDVDTNGNILFKFSEDDTLTTSIDDLDKDLSDNKNREFTQERMREAISLQGELLIYYA